MFSIIYIFWQLFIFVVNFPFFKDSQFSKILIVFGICGYFSKFFEILLFVGIFRIFLKFWLFVRFYDKFLTFCIFWHFLNALISLTYIDTSGIPLFTILSRLAQRCTLVVSVFYLIKFLIQVRIP